MPHQRAGQTIELATGQQHILAAERTDDPLADAPALALVLDEVEIAMAARCLLPNKHRDVVQGFDDQCKQK